MFTKKITYEDFFGNTVTDELNFNYTKAEIADLQLTTPGSYTGSLEKKKDALDGIGLLKDYKDFIINAYGEVSADGKKFIKNDKIKEEFACSQAFSEIYIEFMNDKKAALEFIAGVMPITKQQREQLRNDEDVRKLIENADTDQ